VTSGGWEGLQGGGWMQHELAGVATAATVHFNWFWRWTNRRRTEQDFVEFGVSPLDGRGQYGIIDANGGALWKLR
jgi:hypothetical protein